MIFQSSVATCRRAADRALSFSPIGAGRFRVARAAGYTASQMRVPLKSSRQFFVGFKFFLVVLCLFVSAPQSRTWAQAASSHLRIYSIDVEGGQSTLLVTPSGASLLVDTGWPGNNGRDADRVQAAMRDAGISRIDHLLVTHYHVDHVGDVPELVKRVPIGEFLDHGENREDSDITRHDYAAYLKAIEGKPHRVVHPGDTIDLPGLSAIVLTADGEHIGAVPGINLSNAKAIVDAIHPRVTIMNNGAHKAGSPEAWQTIHESPGMQDLYMVH